jgi:hypothetical protein
VVGSQHETKLVQHELRHDDTEKIISENRSFIRGAIWVAGAVGAALAVLGPVLVSGAKTILFPKT